MVMMSHDRRYTKFYGFNGNAAADLAQDAILGDFPTLYKLHVMLLAHTIAISRSDLCWMFAN